MGNFLLLLQKLAAGLCLRSGDIYRSGGFGDGRL